jgi:hypothetical protein
MQYVIVVPSQAMSAHRGLGAKEIQGRGSGSVTRGPLASDEAARCPDMYGERTALEVERPWKVLAENVCPDPIEEIDEDSLDDFIRVMWIDVEELCCRLDPGIPRPLTHDHLILALREFFPGTDYVLGPFARDADPAQKRRHLCILVNLAQKMALLERRPVEVCDSRPSKRCRRCERRCRQI